MTNIPDFILENKKIIDSKLNDLLKSSDNNIVNDAMNYSVSIGGKRIRPCFVIEFCKACGGKIEDAIDLACAVEMIHTYSLIHDDLPCMDDDDFRRGMPSCHIKYGYANALLAGDALLTKAFQVASNANLSSDKIIKAVNALSSYSGVSGMIGGQVLDLSFETKSAELHEILEMYKLKTGALLALSAKLGCIAAGACDELVNSSQDYAYNVGYAFQIKDDILDVIGDEKLLGKPIGSDSANSKNTVVAKLGLEASKQEVVKYTNLAISSISNFDDSNNLTELANYLLAREF